MECYSILFKRIVDYNESLKVVIQFWMAVLVLFIP